MLGCLRPRNDDILRSRRLDQELHKMNQEFQNAIKILLLGTAESGKTTIIKQMKILHINGFSDEERREKISEIRWNIFEAIYVLVQQMNLLNLDFESNSCKKSANYIIALGDKPDIEVFSNAEYKDHIINLWNNQNVRNFFKYRSNELHLSDSAKYFFDNFERISSQSYTPSTDDILHSRKVTTGIHQIKFKVKIPKGMGGGYQEFRMFDVGGQRDQRNKWIQVFEGIQAVLFLISCGDFDQVLREDSKQNRLVEALTLFDRVWHNRFLSTAGVIVFLNKQDVMERKIRAGKRIGDYFPEYEEFRKSPGKNGNFFDECDWTKNFIKQKLIDITNQPLRRPSRLGLDDVPRECYYHFTVATDTNNIRKVFTDVHNMILSENLASVGLL
ncbi:guanine nucleotide-binding protein G(f) subunit alpha isoform X1 [Condylostylus longicornis]|uniref:guanine nucleotide-binding protein G(f) subunit alpha isoform X1 n=1 Tax=Condylostylus longicornis TaxID=2530218 RepID=UPI00244E0379|nr:guanine nucleotide-binding protein G(f) subunit alpha isoform X1 [Condylostylus longicornis]